MSNEQSEKLKIKIEAHAIGFHDERALDVYSTRGDVAKKLDEICADIEAGFEH